MQAPIVQWLECDLAKVVTGVRISVGALLFSVRIGDERNYINLETRLISCIAILSRK